MWDTHRAQKLFLFIWTAATLGIVNRINETLGITVDLKITSQAANFIKQALLFLACGRSSVAKTVN
jgi:hypothetical protein